MSAKSALVVCSILLLLTLGGCGHYRPFRLDPRQDYSGLRLLQFRHIAQKQRFDCGPGALAIVLEYWGVRRSPEQILAAVFQDKTPKEGTTAGDLAQYARRQGLEAFLLRLSVDEIREQLDRGRPLIVCRPVFGGNNHFEVVVGCDRARREIIIANPANGVVACDEDYFEKIHEKSDRFTLLIVPAETE